MSLPHGAPASTACFDYFEHDADVGIIGRGETLEEAFEAAAVATFAIMTDLSRIRLDVTEAVAFEEADTELALVRWLNLLLATAREKGVMFARFSIERDGVNWRGAASGEPWRADLEHGVEVKGATLTMLSVKCTDGVWEVRCVVDV